MYAEVTTRVVITDEMDRHIATVERTKRMYAGGNPRFFLSETMPTATGNTEEAVLPAFRAVDRSAYERAVSDD